MMPWIKIEVIDTILILFSKFNQYKNANTANFVH